LPELKTPSAGERSLISAMTSKLPSFNGRSGLSKSADEKDADTAAALAALWLAIVCRKSLIGR
jgi:hypothetical protein